MYHDPLSPKLFDTLQRQLDSAKMKRRCDLTIIINIFIKSECVACGFFFIFASVFLAYQRFEEEEKCEIISFPWSVLETRRDIELFIVLEIHEIFYFGHRLEIHRKDQPFSFNRQICVSHFHILVTKKKCSNSIRSAVFQYENDFHCEMHCNLSIFAISTVHEYKKKKCAHGIVLY